MENVQRSLDQKETELKTLEARNLALEQDNEVLEKQCSEASAAKSVDSAEIASQME